MVRTIPLPLETQPPEILTPGTVWHVCGAFGEGEALIVVAFWGRRDRAFLSASCCRKESRSGNQFGSHLGPDIGWILLEMVDSEWSLGYAKNSRRLASSLLCV
jgi:hypothetical protein